MSRDLRSDRIERLESERAELLAQNKAMKAIISKLLESNRDDIGGGFLTADECLEYTWLTGINKRYEERS